MSDIVQIRRNMGKIWKKMSKNTKSMPDAKPEVKKPEFVISGGPSIKQCEILNDKRHILTKDTENNVSLYDVLKARKVEDLGQVEFEQEVKKRLQVSIKVLLKKILL